MGGQRWVGADTAGAGWRCDSPCGLRVASRRDSPLPPPSPNEEHVTLRARRPHSRWRRPGLPVLQEPRSAPAHKGCPAGGAGRAPPPRVEPPVAQVQRPRGGARPGPGSASAAGSGARSRRGAGRGAGVGPGGGRGNRPGAGRPRPRPRPGGGCGAEVFGRERGRGGGPRPPLLRGVLGRCRWPRGGVRGGSGSFGKSWRRRWKGAPERASPRVPGGLRGRSPAAERGEGQRLRAVPARLSQRRFFSPGSSGERRGEGGSSWAPAGGGGRRLALPEGDTGAESRDPGSGRDQLPGAAPPAFPSLRRSGCPSRPPWALKENSHPGLDGARNRSRQSLGIL